jgi:transcription factor E
MLKKFLREVVINTVGKQAEGIDDLLNSKKHVNEFLIAKKLNITINQTRNILYKISDYGLVSSIRKKDKRKGWYTYFWKIEVLKSLEFLRAILIKKIDHINHQIKSRETREFYVCERCNIEFNEENALLHNFTCDECGDIFIIKDNIKVLKEFKRNLDKLQRELKLIDEEIKKEKEKVEKIKLKELKKEEKGKKKISKVKIVKKKKSKISKFPKKEQTSRRGRMEGKKKISKVKIVKKKKIKKKVKKQSLRPRLAKVKKKQIRPGVAKLKKKTSKDKKSKIRRSSSQRKKSTKKITGKKSKIFNLSKFSKKFKQKKIKSKKKK